MIIDSLIQDIYGHRGAIPSGPSLVYLYRRYGFTAHGSDDQKEVCRYYIPTVIEGLLVGFSVRGKLTWPRVDMLYEVRCRFHEEENRPVEEWRERCAAWAVGRGTPLMELASGDEDFDPVAWDLHNQPIYEAYELVELPPDPNDPTVQTPFVRACYESVEAVLRDQLRPVEVGTVRITILGEASREELGDLDEETEEFSGIVPYSLMAGRGVPADCFAEPLLFAQFINNVRAVGDGDLAVGMRRLMAQGGGKNQVSQQKSTGGEGSL